MGFPNDAAVGAFKDYCNETLNLVEGVTAAALRFAAEGGSIDEAARLYIKESRLGVATFLDEAKNGLSPNFIRAAAGLHLAVADIYSSLPPDAQAMVPDKRLIEAVTRRSDFYQSMLLSTTQKT